MLVAGGWRLDELALNERTRTIEDAGRLDKLERTRTIEDAGRLDKLERTNRQTNDDEGEERKKRRQKDDQGQSRINRLGQSRAIILSTRTKRLRLRLKLKT